MKSFLSSVCAHTTEKFPLKMALAGHAGCLIPSMLVVLSDNRKMRFSRMVKILYIKLLITGSGAEYAKK